jgi:hypothetical protein
VEIFLIWWKYGVSQKILNVRQHFSRKKKITRFAQLKRKKLILSLVRCSHCLLTSTSRKSIKAHTRTLLAYSSMSAIILATLCIRFIQIRYLTSGTRPSVVTNTLIFIDACIAVKDVVVFRFDAVSMLASSLAWFDLTRGSGETVGATARSIGVADSLIAANRAISSNWTFRSINLRSTVVIRREAFGTNADRGSRNAVAVAIAIVGVEARITKSVILIATVSKETVQTLQPNHKQNPSFSTKR